MSQNSRDQNGGEIRILDLVEVFIRQWRVILTLLMAALAIGCVVVLVQPRRYIATVVVVPSAGNSVSSAGLLASQLGGGGLISQIAGANPGERLIGAILDSRSMADSVALQVAGHDPAAAEVRTVVAAQSETQTDANGSIKIIVRDQDPSRAARIANAFPAVVNRLAAQLGSEAALRKQEFFDRQLDIARSRLDVAEQRLVQFQRKEDLPEVQEQARRAIDAAASLQQRVMEQQMKIAQLRRTTTAENPELQSAIADLGALRRQLSSLTAGTPDNQVLLSFRASPELKVASASLVRDYSQAEQVLSSLMSAYVQAQIDAQSDLPVLTVLDPATVPTAPDRSWIVVVIVISLVVGMALGLIAAFVREYFSRARHDPENVGFFLALADLRRDVRQLIPGRPRAPL